MLTLCAPALGELFKALRFYDAILQVRVQSLDTTGLLLGVQRMGIGALHVGCMP